MQNCPACGDVIGDDCEICPYCGINVVDSLPQSGRKTKKSAIRLLVAGVAALLCVVFLQISRAREAALRSHCRNNLKQIGLALHNYQDTFGVLPPAYFADDNGTPIHSWRIMLQPFLDAGPVYNVYQFNEPWNGPHNRQLIERYKVVGYRCPASGAPNAHATCLAAVGKHSVIGPGTSVATNKITDGASNTIVAGESHDPSVPWLQPTDVDIDAAEPTMNRPGGFNSRHTGGFYVLLADGSARFISGNISPDTFRALLTRDGGETVGDF